MHLTNFCHCSRIVADAPPIEKINNALGMKPTTLRSQNLPWGQDDVLINVSIYLGYSRTLEYHEIRLGRLVSPFSTGIVDSR